MAVLGGAKVSGKLDVITNLLPKVDELLLGGAMACTFFLAMGLEVGTSLVERDRVDLGKDLLKRSGKKLVLPRGAVIAQALTQGAATRTVARDAIPAGWAVYDLDPATQQDFARRITAAQTVVWNGPVGVFEREPFAKGTEVVARAIAESTAYSIAGGGDTVAAINKFGIADKIGYISTAGGAFLEFLEGKTLPAVAALEARAAG